MALAAYRPSPELLERIVDLNGDLTSVTVMAGVLSLCQLRLIISEYSSVTSVGSSP